MAANTPRRLGSTLPPCSSPSLVEDGKRWSCSESQQLVPEPFQSIPAQELLKDSHCRKCGWIRKEGGSLKTWRDRYFILHKGCLYYYNRPEATTTAGKFSLGGYRLSPAPEKSAKFQWTFKLVHLQPEKRTYYFAAYSEKEMTEWMESINADMSEYCGTGRQTIIEPSTDSGEEYCYPEVEPKFNMEQLAALFGKCPLPGSGETGASQQPTSDPVYCPPPEIDPRDIPRKSPRLPRPAPPSPKPGLGRQKMGFSYMGPENKMPTGPSSLRPMRQPSPGSSPIFNRKPDLPPDVPSRQGKPLAPPKPLSRPPPPTKRATAPVLTYPSNILNSEDDDDEEGEGYLDIVPDTNPDDVANEAKQSTLSRSVQYLGGPRPAIVEHNQSQAAWGFPDGQSFRKHHSEDVLPSSALRLDVDKMEVHYLLENKLGVYIMRESQNAQSKRALSVWTGEKVRHYMLFYDEKLGYALDPEGERFDDMKDLLRHYYKSNLPKCDVKLTSPYK